MNNDGNYLKPIVVSRIINTAYAGGKFASWEGSGKSRGRGKRALCCYNAEELFTSHDGKVAR